MHMAQGDLSFLPGELRHAITTHIEKGTRSAYRAWFGAQDEEDSLTGALGHSLSTPGPQLFETADNAWEWEVRYVKFRSKGPGAPERPLGADGLIFVSAASSWGHLNKGLFFQAKKVTERDTTRTMRQIRKMESVVRGGSALFQYGPGGFKGALGSQPDEFGDLGTFLAHDFFGCSCGAQDLFFDFGSRTLVLPNGSKIDQLRLQITGIEIRQVARAFTTAIQEQHIRRY